MTGIQQITCYRYNLPLIRKTNLAGVIQDRRKGLLFHVMLESGVAGWGEAAPLPGFSDETLEEVLTAAWIFSQNKVGISLEGIRQKMATGTITSPSLYFAFDSALRQCESVGLDKPEVAVPLCALVIGDIDTACMQVETALGKGYQTVKVKVGSAEIGDDVKKAKRLLCDFTGDCRWRFDANRAWDYETALRFCDVIAGDNAVDYIEEPLRDFGRMQELAEASGVPCAVDETLQELSRCLFSNDAQIPVEQEAILRHTVESAQALVWKPSLCMNPKSMNLDTIAPVVLSGAYESGVGTASILEYAVQDTEVCPIGIDTYSRLELDLLDERLPLGYGEVSLSEVRTTAVRININLLEEVWHV